MELTQLVIWYKRQPNIFLPVLKEITTRIPQQHAAEL